MSGPWPPHVLGTAEGRRIDLLDPDPGEIRVSDIVRGLIRQNRFAGQTQGQCTVAEHSLRVMGVALNMGAPREVQLAALYHDAHEAYIGDLTRPLRTVVPEIVDVARRLDWAIAEHLDIPASLFTDPVVTRADAVVLSMEGRHYLPGCDHEWPVPPEDCPHWTEMLVGPLPEEPTRNAFGFHTHRLGRPT